MGLAGKIDKRIRENEGRAEKKVREERGEKKANIHPRSDTTNWFPNREFPPNTT